MIYRNASSIVIEALKDTPAVFINGARQVGKSTLAKWIAQTVTKANYYTFDDLNTLGAALESPENFLKNLRFPVVIDEVQKAPNIFTAIKKMIDDDRKAGSFLLTGSTNIMLVPRLSQELVGRTELVHLFPLSIGEILGREEHFVDFIFSDSFNLNDLKPDPNFDLRELILRGGFPEILKRQTLSRRRAWHKSYISTLLQRELKDISQISNLHSLSRLLSVLASRTCSIVNYAELSRSLGIPQMTLKRYFALLKGLFLIDTMRSWQTNIGKRFVKSPKLIFNDVGLLSSILNLTPKTLVPPNPLFGQINENFVINELRKQIPWNKTSAELFFFRCHTGQEVDIVLEDESGQLAGIEVKAGESLSGKDFYNLRYFAELTGRRFKRGIVMYNGNDVFSFGQNLFALPVSSLWSVYTKTG